MRASHSPGASTSAGVGRSSSSAHRRARASSPARSTTPSMKLAPPVDLGLADVEPEEPGEGLLALGVLNPVAVPGLAQRRRRGGEGGGDARGHVVDVGADGRWSGQSARWRCCAARG